MTYPVYYDPKPSQADPRIILPGFWRIEEPMSADDIDYLISISHARQGKYRQMIVHGIPFKVSPEWALRHPGEAAKGEMTIPYALSEATLYEALSIAALAQEGIEDEEYEEILTLDVATDFANIAISATREHGWKKVLWIDIVDVAR